MFVNRKHLPLALFFGLLTLYFGFFWSHALHYDAQNNFVAGEANIWGDWAAHFTMATALAERGPILFESPFLFGAQFSYPFVSDGVSALLLNMGVPFVEAFIWPSFVFSILLVVALFGLYKYIFKKEAIAILAVIMFLANGGTGFWWYIQDLAHSTTPLQTIINPPNEYTDMEPEVIRWISVINSMIVPQRAFVMGFPLAIIALIIVYRSIFESDFKLNNKYLAILILILGLMPIIHTHSFLATFVIMSCWVGWLFWKHRRSQIKDVWSIFKPWIIVGAGTSIIALPLIGTFLAHNVSQSFTSWHPGWYAYNNPNLGWVEFWIKNWGIVPLLAVMGWVFFASKQAAKNRLRTLFIFAPFVIIFAMANLWLWQPFIWDNTKLIVWVSVGFSGLSAYALYYLWQGKHWALKTLVAAAFIFSTLSGGLDGYRMIRFNLHEYQMYSQEEIQLSQWATNSTSSDSIWLTGDQHNHWLYNLTGRQALLAYRGWLWTHGYNYHDIENDQNIMFANPEQALSQGLFEKYGVDYVVIGPNELEVWRANKAEYDQNFELARESLRYSVYSIK